MRTLRFSLIVVLSLAALPIFSATYIVPEDRDLISAARGIVSGTVTSTHVRRGVRIETVTQVAVEEWIKGTGGQSVSVVLPGGQLGEKRLTVPGVPSFTPGDRVLLFLSRDGRGEWTTWSWALGAFRSDGRGMLTRGGEEVFGWTVDGARHVERPRLERAFVDYVRAVVRGESAAPESFAAPASPASMLRVQPDATFTAGSYSYQPGGLPLRRNGAVAEWRVSGAVGDLDVVKAADTGVAAWSSITATFRDTRGAAPASGDTDGDDGEWRIIANDPHNEIPDTCCVGIVAGTFLIDSGSHAFNGETFRTLTHADLLVNDGMSSANFNQDRLDDVVTHEIGHTLALRHADRNGANDGACGGGANCCSFTNDGGNCLSVMNSLEIAGVTGLQTWDRHAIACLYEGSCTTPCTAPRFLETPESDVIYAGTSALLSTRVRGTPPLVVQWFAGAKGDTSRLVEAGEWDVRVRPEATSKYWVRVTDACGQIDSEAAELTVVRCPNVTLTSASATIVAPGKVRLRALAGESSRYRWFRSQGPGLPGSLIGLARDITISYTAGATFWVRVENSCGKAAVSEVLTPSPTPPPARRRRSRH